MSKVLIFQYIDCEGPGYLGRFLARAGRPYRVVRVDAGDPIPNSIDGATALAFMGGPMSVNDEFPWIADALGLIQRAHRHQLPLLGHCLGGQLIGKALGARVTANPVKEIGWFPVETVRQPQSPDWCRRLPDTFEAFHWHGETFSLPPGAIRLFQTAACANQGFTLGKTIALQFHIEMTSSMVAEWADRYREEIARPDATIQDNAQLLRDLPARLASLHDIADQFYSHWMSTF